MLYATLTLKNQSFVKRFFGKGRILLSGISGQGSGIRLYSGMGYPAPQLLQQQRLTHDHPLKFTEINTLVRTVDL